MIEGSPSRECQGKEGELKCMQIRLHPEYVLEVLVDLRPNSTGIVLGTLVRASKKWETFYLSVTNTAPICSEEEGGRRGKKRNGNICCSPNSCGIHMTTMHDIEHSKPIRFLKVLHIFILYHATLEASDPHCIISRKETQTNPSPELR